MKKLGLLVYALCLSLVSLTSFADDKVYADANEKIPVSTGRYITGGILSSTVGLGIGHAIEGRYAEKGWIFTTGDVAGILIAAPAIAQCANDIENRSDKSCTTPQNNQIGAGIAIWLGFHIWEIVDIWTAATPVDEKVSAFILPTPLGPAAGLVYRF